MNDTNDEEFQRKVEQIIDKYLRREQYKAPVHIDEIAQIEKEFQKVKLVKNIINQFTSMMETSIENLHDTLNSRLESLDAELSVVKDMVIRSWADMTIRPTSSRNNSMIESDFINESFCSEDKSTKDLMKKIREIEESTRRKITSTENHLNLLVDAQIQLKIQLQQLEQSSTKSSQNTKLQDNIVKDLSLKMEDLLDKRVVQLTQTIQDIQVKDREKQKYYWSIINDLSDKFEKMRKDTEPLLNNTKKPEEKQGALGMFRRSSLLPF